MWEAGWTRGGEAVLESGGLGVLAALLGTLPHHGHTAGTAGHVGVEGIEAAIRAAGSWVDQGEGRLPGGLGVLAAL